MILLKSGSSDGKGEPKEWSGVGPGTLQLCGTWDGATVKIEGSIDNGKTWIQPSNSTYFENSIVSFEMGIGLVRTDISDSGPSTDISVYLSGPERQ